MNVGTKAAAERQQALRAVHFERRAIVCALAVGALAAASPAGAQPAGRPKRVALVFLSEPLSDMSGPDPPEPSLRAFVRRLRELGWVEGRNLVIERHTAEGRREQLADLMRQMVALGVDVIVTGATGAVAAAQVTDRTPIVATFGGDPRQSGLTDSLARPTRNVTGVAVDTGEGILGKRLQLLHEAAPAATRVAVIDFPYVDARLSPGVQSRRLELEAAARALGITLVPVGVSGVDGFDAAFASLAGRRVDALFDVGIYYAQRQRILDFAAGQRLPAIHPAREYAEAGGLIAYGANAVRAWRRMAEQTDRILRGAKPADVPFEQPTHFELVINARTARALGLNLPPALLLRADDVIE
ncbi:MAG: ABC transporter substrate-binding protein [Burkholderiales bacterium]|nr:ABC transporter substrate-binding protein [Burkholderiales bacterium]